MVLSKVVAVALAAEIVLSFAPAEDSQKGWIKKDGQSWYYIKDDGECLVSDWVKDGGKWYYCDEDGRMISGVEDFYIDGAGYDFDSTGACTNPDAASEKLTGWQKMTIEQVEFHSDTEYSVYYVYRWFYFDSDGSPVYGWQEIDGKWYFFVDDYVEDWNYRSAPWMLFNDETRPRPQQMELNKFYYFKPSGEMVIGWYFDGNYWRFARTNGELYRNEWYQENGKWYYFNDDCEMYADVENVSINGIYYNFASNGVCTNPDATAEKREGWFKEYISRHSYCWFYFDENGEKVTGWKQIDGTWYYFDPETAYMNYGNTLMINDKKYRFADNGAMYVGWSSYLTKAGTILWWYSAPDGSLYINKWLSQDGNWYYFGSDAQMVSNVEDYEINGIAYTFDENGVCQNPDATAKKSVWDKESGEWVYYDENGEKVKGWKEIDDVWYYFDPETAYMNSGNILTLNGKKYKFADDGAMCVGWSKYLNKAGTTLWWYSGPDGALYVEKWLFQDGKWYYFGSDAEMIANVKDYVVNGVAYDFDENGVCLNP